MGNERADGRESRSERPADRREALEAVARRVGGTLVEGRMVGGYAVLVGHRAWTLALDLSVGRSGMVQLVDTRVVTRSPGMAGFELRVRPRTAFDRVLDVLWPWRSPEGDRALRARFVVRGRPGPRVRTVLSGGVAAAVLGGPACTVVVKRAPRKHRAGLGSGALQLEVLSPGVDTDVERMVGMLAVAGGVLDALERGGVASRPR